MRPATEPQKRFIARLREQCHYNLDAINIDDIARQIAVFTDTHRFKTLAIREARAYVAHEYGILQHAMTADLDEVDIAEASEIIDALQANYMVLAGNMMDFITEILRVAIPWIEEHVAPEDEDEAVEVAKKAYGLTEAQVPTTHEARVFLDWYGDHDHDVLGMAVLATEGIAGKLPGPWPDGLFRPHRRALLTPPTTDAGIRHLARHHILRELHEVLVDKSGVLPAYDVDALAIAKDAPRECRAWDLADDAWGILRYETYPKYADFWEVVTQDDDLEAHIDAAIDRAFEEEE